MTTDVMIDLETLAVDPDAVILTLGGVKFDPYTLDEPFEPLYHRIDVDEQVNLGRKIDQNTMDWWAKQDAKAQEEAFSEEDRISVDELLKSLNKYVVGANNLWCQGPLFDYAMLQHLYWMMGQPCPWNFWQIRDSRTVFSMMARDPRKDVQEDLHNALADSYYQAKAIQKSFEHFGVKK